jgi:hypothetical protein
VPSPRLPATTVSCWRRTTSAQESGPNPSSATFTATGCACCCTAASRDKLTAPRDCEAALHASRRRARLHSGNEHRRSTGSCANMGSSISARRDSQAASNKVYDTPAYEPAPAVMMVNLARHQIVVGSCSCCADRKIRMDCCIVTLGGRTMRYHLDHHPNRAGIAAGALLRSRRPRPRPRRHRRSGDSSSTRARRATPIPRSEGAGHQ